MEQPITKTNLFQFNWSQRIENKTPVVLFVVFAGIVYALIQIPRGIIATPGFEFLIFAPQIFLLIGIPVMILWNRAHRNKLAQQNQQLYSDLSQALKESFPYKPLSTGKQMKLLEGKKVAYDTWNDFVLLSNGEQAYVSVRSNKDYTYAENEYNAYYGYLRETGNAKRKAPTAS